MQFTKIASFIALVGAALAAPAPAPEPVQVTAALTSSRWLRTKRKKKDPNTSGRVEVYCGNLRYPAYKWTK
ncbi:hypothetical protein IF2G_10115 [Cordyceps javanica]|nr:hypothetical protein IF2G_10115 [Cordyceps javanica]